MKPTARRRPKGERMEGSQRRSRPARRETLVRPRMNIPWAYGPVGQIKAGEPLRWEWSVRAHRVGSASNGQELGLPILCVWMDINPTRRGPVAQRFERSAHNRKDGGSNPSGPNSWEAGPGPKWTPTAQSIGRGSASLSNGGHSAPWPTSERPAAPPSVVSRHTDPFPCSGAG